MFDVGGSRVCEPLQILASYPYRLRATGHVTGGQKSSRGNQHSRTIGHMSAAYHPDLVHRGAGIRARPIVSRLHTECGEH